MTRSEAAGTARGITSELLEHRRAADCASPFGEMHFAVTQDIASPNFASQMRVAFSSMAWNTGSSSPGELADDVQHLRRCRLLLQRLGRSSVRCRNSLSSRVFSMAMTAWAAKFSTRAICLSVKGRTSWR